MCFEHSKFVMWIEEDRHLELELLPSINYRIINFIIRLHQCLLTIHLNFEFVYKGPPQIVDNRSLSRKTNSFTNYLQHLRTNKECRRIFCASLRAFERIAL